MASGLLGIASSGLMAFQRSLTTISHNIVNVNTDGYSRQIADLTAREPQYTGSTAYDGAGVDVKTISRSYDSFLTMQVRTSTSTHSELDAYYRLATQVDNLIADPDSGLAPAMQSFFSSLHGVANEPSSIPARRAMLTSAETLVNRFTVLNKSFDGLRDQAQQAIESSLNQVNALSANLAALNHRIVAAQGAAGGAPPNDLLDQRDQLLLNLAEHLDIQAIPQADGSVNVLVGSGQALVMGTEAASLKMQDSSFGGSVKEIALYAKGSGNSTVITSKVSGGTIGGLLGFQKEFLDPLQNDMGRVAAAFSAQFNAQHKLGFDLNGNAGVDFFQAPQTTVLGKSGNSAGATLNATFADYNALSGADYRIDVTASGANLTNLRTQNTAAFTFATPPGTFSHEGLDFTLAGAATGDSFLVQPTRNAAGAMAVSAALADPGLIAASGSAPTPGGTAKVGDNVNALALVDLQSAKNLLGGKASYQEAYNAIVGTVGNLTKSAEINTAAQKSLLDHATEQRASAAGVNLDEEAANLVQFQQAYQAAAQMIVTAQSTFDALIGAVRR